MLRYTRIRLPPFLPRKLPVDEADVLRLPSIGAGKNSVKFGERGILNLRRFFSAFRGRPREERDCFDNSVAGQR